MPGKRIFVPSCLDGSSLSFWRHLGKVTDNWEEFEADPSRFDLVGFTGGSDISPELYGHENLASYPSPSRDRIEVKAFRIAHDYGIPMTGICRGGQLLCAMYGGTLVQDINVSHGDGGGGGHSCQTIDGENFRVSSAHHQMIVPTEDAVILGWAGTRVAPEHLTYDGELPKIVYDPEDPEVCRVTEAFMIEKYRTFSVQGHPEWMNPNSEFTQWSLRKTREICWGE